MSTGSRPTRGPLSKSSWSNSQRAEAASTAAPAPNPKIAVQPGEVRILRDRWGVPHIHGATAEAEAPAREAAEVFQTAQARESQVRAWVFLGRSLVGQGKPDLAQSEIERATRLAAKGADIAPRLQAAAAARVRAV